LLKEFSPQKDPHLLRAFEGGKFMVD